MDILHDQLTPAMGGSRSRHPMDMEDFGIGDVRSRSNSMQVNITPVSLLNLSIN